jgi:hypothetical protein
MLADIYKKNLFARATGMLKGAVWPVWDGIKKVSRYRGMDIYQNTAGRVNKKFVK